MHHSKFLGTVLVIVLGVNMTGWALSVATNPTLPGYRVSIPISPSAINAQSQSASVQISQNEEFFNTDATSTSTSTEYAQ